MTSRLANGLAIIPYKTELITSERDGYFRLFAYFGRNRDSTLAMDGAKLLNFAELASCGTEGLSHEFALHNFTH